jgi:hypothetical protein
VQRIVGLPNDQVVGIGFFICLRFFIGRLTQFAHDLRQGGSQRLQQLAGPSRLQTPGSVAIALSGLSLFACSTSLVTTRQPWRWRTIALCSGHTPNKPRGRHSHGHGALICRLRPRQHPSHGR